MNKKSVLIVCTGNTCRSPLVATILNNHISKSILKNKIFVSSGGISAQNGDSASEHAITIAKNLGLDLTNHNSQQVTQQILDKYDLILCVTQRHKMYILHNFNNTSGKCFTLSECTNSDRGDIDDPFGESLDCYVKISNDIENSMPNLIKFLEKFFNEDSHRK